MFTIDRSLAAEIDYRTQRIAEAWVPRRRKIRVVVARPRRRLHAGRPGAVGTVAPAR